MRTKKLSKGMGWINYNVNDLTEARSVFFFSIEFTNFHNLLRSFFNRISGVINSNFYAYVYLRVHRIHPSYRRFYKDNDFINVACNRFSIFQSTATSCSYSFLIAHPSPKFSFLSTTLGGPNSFEYLIFF